MAISTELSFHVLPSSRISCGSKGPSSAKRAAPPRGGTSSDPLLLCSLRRACQAINVRGKHANRTGPCHATACSVCQQCTMKNKQKLTVWMHERSMAKHNKMNSWLQQGNQQPVARGHCNKQICNNVTTAALSALGAAFAQKHMLWAVHKFAYRSSALSVRP